MALRDLFGKDSRTDLAETRTALEAAAKPDDSGILPVAVTRLVENLLASGIDGKGPFKSAAAIAAAALEEHGGDREAALKDIQSLHLKLAAASGFVTSLGGFITLPVALPANVLGFYALATRMTAAIAQVRGYDITDPQIRSAVLLTLVGTEADDLLRKVGTVPTAKLSNVAAERLPGPVLMVVNKAVGFRVLANAGAKGLTRFGKALPVAGGAIGAGLDGYLMRAIAKQARKEFPAQRQLSTS